MTTLRLVAARLAAPPDPRTDAGLVADFLRHADQAAFAELVRRHGPMVLGVCRRALGPTPDAEDAFQATFLVLVRRARSTAWRAALGPWLFGVAARVARKARAARARRLAAERQATAMTPEPTAPPAEPGDLGDVLDRELAALPEAYRRPLVLCELQGLTRAAAARELGLAEGTLSSRLARGRRMLRDRLTRRGVAPAAGGLAVTVPAGLAQATAGRAVALLTGAAGAVPAGVLALVNEVTRGMLLTKLQVVAVLLLAAGVAAVAAPGQPPAPAAPPPAPAKVDPPAPKREPTAARKLLDRLRELKPEAGQALEDDSAAVLRDLIKLGPAAVPDLIAELDAATDPFVLRCLGFAARAIGDKRVVPALIRALPKTCQPPASDYGLIAADPELLRFMQAHSHDKRGVGGTHYSFGRPITEFRSALQSLTGTSHGEDELNFVFLGGSARQKELQRGLYRRCAERWAAWWEKNAKGLVADPKYLAVGLPPRPPAAAPPAAAEFPRGPRVEIDAGMTGCLIESVRAAGAKSVFVDLDTGRAGALPEKLRPAPGKPERLDDILAWAAEEGYDLMGTEYTPPGGKDSHYVIRGLGLTAWLVGADRRDTIAAAIRSDKPPELGKRAGDLLVPFDAAGRYRAAETGLFLFRTREGGFGWISVGVEVHDDTLQPGGAAGGDLDLNPVGFHKGRRYSYTLVWDGGQEPGPAKDK